jgi:hypothetical protein
LHLLLSLQISSPKNYQHFVDLLQHFGPGINPSMNQLVNDQLATCARSFGSLDEIDFVGEVAPLRLSRQSSYEQPPKIRPEIERSPSEAEGKHERTV